MSHHHDSRAHSQYFSNFAGLDGSKKYLQIASADSGKHVWTYENQYRPMRAPPYGSFIGWLPALRTFTPYKFNCTCTAYMFARPAATL